MCMMPSPVCITNTTDSTTAVQFQWLQMGDLSVHRLLKINLIRAGLCLVLTRDRIACHTTALLWFCTWSASTKMILSTARGKSTSRNRILYPQMILCFSVCWWSQRGHLYCTSSYWKPYSSAIYGINSYKKIDKNVTLLSFLITN